MIGALLSGLFGLVISLINLILAPIDALIASLLPDLSNALSYVANLFTFVNGVIGYAIDASGLSDISITLIVSYYVFVISGTFSASVVKLALKWYDKLKP